MCFVCEKRAKYFVEKCIMLLTRLLTLLLLQPTQEEEEESKKQKNSKNCRQHCVQKHAVARRRCVRARRKERCTARRRHTVVAHTIINEDGDVGGRHSAEVSCLVDDVETGRSLPCSVVASQHDAVVGVWTESSQSEATSVGSVHLLHRVVLLRAVLFVTDVKTENGRRILMLILNDR